MLALLLAVALTAAPRYDTIITRQGERLAGTVVEESPTKGVTIELPDGTMRRFEPGGVVRIEFADGSVSVWDPPRAEAPPAPAAPQAAPPPAAAPPTAAARDDGPLDTLFLATGGRVRGRVLEELPREGVTIQVSDGTIRRYGPEQISRIEYGDGSVSRRRRPLPPPYPAAYAPPPVAPPPGYGPPVTGPPEPAPQRRGMPALTPLYAAFGLGGMGYGGELATGVPVHDVVNGQLDLFLEGGLRLTPAVALGVYGDIGVGDPASQVRATCSADCVATTMRFGVLLRHTWDPTGPTAPWLAVGTGWAGMNVSTSSSGSGGSSDLFTYRGREVFRLMGGVDLRSNPVFGIGLYAGVSWSEFSSREDAMGKVSIDNRSFHTMGEGGIRLTLFP